MSEQTVEAVAHCRTCAGCGWVCENHRDTPWSGLVQQETECCGGAGAPCGACDLEMASAGYVDRAIAAHTKALIEGAGEIGKALLFNGRYGNESNDQRAVRVNEERRQAAATIAALRAEIERAKEEGVRAGIEAAAGAFVVEAQTWLNVPVRGSCARQGAKAIRALDAAAIAKAPD